MFQNIWFVAAIWMALALAASLVSIWSGISVALIEILVGVIAGNFLHLQSNNEWIGFLAMLGSGVLTFLAGAEIDPHSLKANLRASALIGVISFASTNLVIELGAVLWVLMGWQFVFAEILGAFVLIAIMWLLIRLFLPKNRDIEIRMRAQEKVQGSMHCHPAGDQEQMLATASPSVGGHEISKWTRVAHAFVTDWSMLWKEILGGFLIAGFLATLMPPGWWEALFLQSGPPAVRLIENALVGPIIAVLSFVCSVGNIPLASLLQSHGISFGGVISSIYADLIVIPIIIIYAK